MVRNCCFCFNLKYGFFTFGILHLASKVSSIFLVDTIIDFLDDEAVEKNEYLAPTLGFCLGWLIASSFCLYLTLKGIVQKRSILMYPYIVVVLFELFCSGIGFTILSIVINPIYLVNLLVTSSVSGYSALCLISLYRKFVSEEKGGTENIHEKVSVKSV